MAQWQSTHLPMKSLGFNPWVWRIPWRIKWQPTPGFLPGKSHGQRGAWQATIHRVAKSQTQLNSTTYWLDFYLLLRSRAYIVRNLTQMPRTSQCSSATQSCPTLWPHESQHARASCPSPTPRVHPNPCPLSQWCHPTISSSVVPSPPALSLSQHQGLFQWVSSSHQLAKVLESRLQHQSLQWTPRTDLL